MKRTRTPGVHRAHFLPAFKRPEEKSCTRSSVPSPLRFPSTELPVPRVTLQRACSHEASLAGEVTAAST